jgi:hypothetical protein
MSLRSCFLAVVLVIGILPQRVKAQISVPESVLTGRNNIRRTGVYDQERQLTPTTVAGGQFGALVTRRVEGQVAAQPLYVKGVTIDGVRKNVVYVVTRKNFIYAFDADNVNPNDPRQGQVWPNPIRLVDCDTPAPSATVCNQDPQKLGLQATPIKGMAGCRQTIGPAGITSTPVIDPASQRMYLVARFGAPPTSPDYGKAVYHYLVSLDIRTGQELQRVRIATPPPKPGEKSPFGTFEGFAELNRPGLLLLNNILYIAFGFPVCDEGEDNTREHAHGWVFAYSVPAMSYLDSYNTSPATGGAGIWQSGAGLAADPSRGFVYALTGNNAKPDDVARNQTGQGTSGYDNLYHPSRRDLGESILKLKLLPNLKFGYDSHFGAPVVEHFTAGNWYRLDTGRNCPAERNDPLGCRNPKIPSTINLRDPIVVSKAGGRLSGDDGDSDLGSGGPVVLSNGLVLGGGKQGRLYVLSPDDFHSPKQTFFAALNERHPDSKTTCKLNNPSEDSPSCAISREDYDVAEAWGPNIHGSPVAWERPDAAWGYLYLMAEKDFLRAYPISRDGQINTTGVLTSQSAVTRKAFPALTGGIQSPDGMPGGAVSVSSNGGSDGIVWVSVAPKDATRSLQPGVLLAFDALTLKLLWYDEDSPVNIAKFVPPTIAGGKVFRATFGRVRECLPDFEGLASCGSVVIYGLRSQITAPAPKDPKVPGRNSKIVAPGPNGGPKIPPQR